MGVRDLLVQFGQDKRLAAFDRHANLQNAVREHQKELAHLRTESAKQVGNSADSHAMTGSVKFSQYLIGGVIEGMFLYLDGGEVVSFSATMWGPGLDGGNVVGAGAFTVPAQQLVGPATVYIATEEKVLELAWFDENDNNLGFFAGNNEGLSVAAQIVSGSFLLVR